jgi:alanyl-tRNA synthetase
MTQKLYLTDSYLFEATARVLEVTPSGTGYDVVLDRTVLFPASGGQPADQGWLDEEAVLDVRLAGTRVVHHTAKPPREDLVVCRVQPQVRLDHMQQHSGQHLLSRIFIKLLDAPTVSFHLGSVSCTIDVAPPEKAGGGRPAHALDEAALAEVERVANEHVQSGHPIRVAPPSSTEIAAAPPDLHALSAGELRIIDMHGLDRSFCCGTHLRSTSEIGPLKILGMERKGSVARVEFLCGQRARAHHERLHRVVTTLIRTSSARPEDLPAYVEGLLSDRESKGRQIRGLQADLARTRAELLASRAEPVGMYRLARLVQRGGTADDLRLLAEQLSAQHGCCFVGGHRPETGDKGVLVVAAPPGSGLHAGKLLGAVLSQIGGRGGGRPELAQGGAPAARVEEAVELAVQEAASRLRKSVAT